MTHEGIEEAGALVAFMRIRVRKRADGEREPAP